MNEAVYKNHDLKLLNRNILSLSGIKRIINFDSSEFIIESVMGNIVVKGSSLEVLLLDTDKGDVKIKGKVDSIVYANKKKESKESLFTKLFK